MPLYDDFDGSFASGLSLTVITAAGAGTTVPIQGIENLSFPTRNFKKDTYVPLSGARARKEQLVLCSEQATEITCTLTYEKAHQIAMDAICGVNGCAITLVGPDGITISGSGGIEKLGVARVEDSKHMTADFTIALAAGWDCADGGTAGVTVVAAYTVNMSGGTATINLTACGLGGLTNLTAKRLTRMVLTASAINGAAITIAKGATTGYDIGGDFTITLLAGQSVTVEGTLASNEVGASIKLLDVTGTGTDGVTVYFEAVTA
jgi:hypothetical protein